MEKMKDFVKRADGFVSGFCGYLSYGASIMILIVMVLVVADVLFRGLFNHPLTGVMEIVRMAIPVIAFFMAPWATHEYRHVRSTVFYMHMPRNLRITVDVLAYAIGAVIFGMLAVASWSGMLRAYSINEFDGEGALRVITWPTRALIVLSGLLVSGQMIRCLVLSVGKPSDTKAADF